MKLRRGNIAPLTIAVGAICSDIERPVRTSCGSMPELAAWHGCGPGRGKLRVSGKRGDEKEEAEDSSSKRLNHHRRRLTREQKEVNSRLLILNALQGRKRLNPFFSAASPSVDSAATICFREPSGSLRTPPHLPHASRLPLRTQEGPGHPPRPVLTASFSGVDLYRATR
jgi:hypothetical protein